MANVQQVKHRMRNYSKEHDLKYAKMNLDSPVWGIGARRNAYRITKHASLMHPVVKASTRKSVVEKMFYPPKPAAVKILYPDYNWNGQPVRIRGSVPGIVWHHTAGYGSPWVIHRQHLAMGERGMPYTFYIRLNGKIYAGRPWGTMGAHCKGHNDWAGVALEGNWDVNKVMPKAQLDAAKALHTYLHKKYGGIPDKQHKDMSGNATACPGRYYPFATITK